MNLLGANLLRLVQLVSKHKRSDEHLLEVGQRVRKVRKLLNLTQSEFGDALDVKQTAVTNWESGRRLPDIMSLILLAEKFHITIDWMLRGDGSGLPLHISKPLMGEQSPHSGQESNFKDTG